MIFIDCEQGSQEWHAARAGAITASKVREALETLKNGQPSAKSATYAAQVAVEIVSGTPVDEGFNSWQMRRGVELEPDARMSYEARTGLLASESGVVLTDDRRFGYSTDGLVGDNGLIEIKCLVSAEKLIAMWDTGDLSEYMHQMQTGMWITGRQWCDFVMYAPQLAPVGKDLFLRRVPRDERFIEKMEDGLMEFMRRVDENVVILRRPQLAEAA